MAEKKFYLESDSELQRIGLRAQVVSFLIAQGIERGNALNDPENKKRVVVAIGADADSRIEEVRDELVKFLNKLHDDDPACYGQFPADIRASQLHELSNPHSIRLLDLNHLANSLMLEQTSKGVGAMLSIPASMEKAMVRSLEPLHGLPQAIEALAKRLK
ncbi:hypothetical protein HY995_01550 [Candidatus Micrarchaeota archaeon]|nr:hypothetical protein [Candidatus Micrarchaeota archaeon]MBI5176752.1 hypothetical protein [Candidatus Micrarchaeota archaeon]